ncbi:hypothetical protein BTHERMOSOX_1936 [Bathymodiolus thermophilus thioautotrophic gill symbiont]|jgi:hypothetical protein|uniref:Uncharacterized protein n=1 Tax=Bathymodiolus thermophilus thioautotrophic gill symbiont TaxID=2360 RepID=A0A1J5U8U0_9GAMM|nr:hypothetical protein [Bathymodiolus thermophilus thioautotrophic gill symbiont]AYQ56243.1 hypothetical protein MS2017_0502 [Bathymodiolus thermophilus thioautotrophic gill symbiont]OIR25270.1 hypothetical protein BGC33_13020 [Bathymodiolus thermophilus thioautotrophic gill symbiont]CAB5501263.1 hypothetical protein THERMOS_1353 [Bathymodiolus thermophilus thioautotrophic gill symbiont]CAB5505678.1 hypothetical protein THERMOT_2197 [Bathymodiolus thermophilus thioautotrophic gill symbiont]SG
MSKKNQKWLTKKTKEERAKKYKKSDFYKAIIRPSLRKNREDREVQENGFAITDHAVFRYYERVKEIDMESLKKEIVPESVQAFICAQKNGEISVYSGGEKYRLKFANKKVITIKR